MRSGLIGGIRVGTRVMRVGTRVLRVGTRVMRVVVPSCL